MSGVNITSEILTQTIHLLEHLDISEYDRSIQYDYHSLYMELLTVQQSIALRNAYADVIHAQNEAARFETRMRYLRLKAERDWF